MNKNWFIFLFIALISVIIIGIDWFIFSLNNLIVLLAIFGIMIGNLGMLKNENN